MLGELFQSSNLYSVKWNSYFHVYEHLFARYVGQRITFVEVGVDEGTSLLMWRQYFQNARVIGVDIDPAASKLEQYGVEIVIGDQASPEFWKQFYQRVGSIDVLLDDGGHFNEQQIVTVSCALPKVRDGGMIVVEDVHASYMAEFFNPSRHSFMNFAKRLVDCVNSRAPFVAKKLPYRDVIASLEFHESIVVMHIDRSRAAQPYLLESRGLDPGPRPTASRGIRRRLGWVKSIPLAGRGAIGVARLWDRVTAGRRVAKYFRGLA